MIFEEAEGLAQHELAALAKHRIYPELDVVNPQCVFEYHGSRRTYPIRGRIDELNVTLGRVVERTLDRAGPTYRPPDQKFLQAWLGARAIWMLLAECAPTDGKRSGDGREAPRWW